MADEHGLEKLDLFWDTPGPVSTKFMLSQLPFQVLNGPYGSGKTTTNFMKHVLLSAVQNKSPRKFEMIKGQRYPLRLYRVATIRDTYRQLWKTTIPSWFKRFPKELGTWTGAENAPSTHKIRFDPGDGSIVEFENIFAAIGETNAEDFVDGFEVTAFFLNAVNLLNADVYTYGKRRTGRFPDMADGGPRWHGITADCNAPEFGNWIYEDHMLKSGPDWEVFRQPGGREAGAENLTNLPPGYYDAKSDDKEWFVERMINNKPGYSRAGKPVHPEFNDTLHVPDKEIEPVPGLPIVIGLDPRTNPSAALMQRMPNGQRRFFDELQMEQNTGPRRFGQALAQLLTDRYPYLRKTSIRGMSDPSAQNGADREAGELDWMQIVSGQVAIRIDPAPTNVLDMRREALKTPLSKLIDAEPGILISPRCKILRAALNAGFRYRKLHTGGTTDLFAQEVEKNNYADMGEAAEYACLSDHAEIEIREREESWKSKRPTAASVVTDWDPLS